MHRFTADLSTILGAAILVGALVGLLIGRITAETFAVVVPAAAVLIGVPQRQAVTTVQTDNAVVAATVVSSEAVPVVERR